VLAATAAAAVATAVPTGRDATRGSRTADGPFRMIHAITGGGSRSAHTGDPLQRQRAQGGWRGPRRRLRRADLPGDATDGTTSPDERG